MDRHRKSHAQHHPQRSLLQTNQRTVPLQSFSWYNHLSPAITKSPWKTHENNSLFEAHARIGNKWKDIARELPGRTDNAVKNHFYSTIRRALRRMDKHFGYKDSTRKMRTLKPSALTYFLEIAQEGTLYAGTSSNTQK